MLFSGLNTQNEPFSSMGAMAVPPRPEKIYTLPFSAVDADPTRGEGMLLLVVVDIVESLEDSLVVLISKYLSS